MAKGVEARKEIGAPLHSHTLCSGATEDRPLEILVEITMEDSVLGSWIHFYVEEHF